MWLCARNWTQQSQTHQWLASLDVCCLLQAWASIEQGHPVQAEALLQQIDSRLRDYAMVPQRIAPTLDTW